MAAMKTKLTTAGDTPSLRAMRCHLRLMTVVSVSLNHCFTVPSPYPHMARNPHLGISSRGPPQLRQ